MTTSPPRGWVISLCLLKPLDWYLKHEFVHHGKNPVFGLWKHEIVSQSEKWRFDSTEVQGIASGQTASWPPTVPNTLRRSGLGQLFGQCRLLIRQARLRGPSNRGWTVRLCRHARLTSRLYVLLIAATQGQGEARFEFRKLSAVGA